MNARSRTPFVGFFVLTVLLLACALSASSQCCAPFITQQPTNQTVYSGSNVTIYVGVTSTGSFPTFQWRWFGTNLPGATSSNLNFPNVQVTNSGDYSLAVTNASGYTISSNANLTVIGAPQITVQPTNKTVTETGATSFSVAATGAAPFTYQWRFYATNILAGQTASTLLLTNVQAWQAGLYSVTVANSYGSATSANANATVTFPVGVAGCWGNNGDPTSTVWPETRGGYTAIAAGGNHSLGLRTNGTVIAWGNNAFGETNVPPGLSNVIAIAAGFSHSLALRSDNTVVGWGLDSFDQATPPPGLIKVTAIAAGAYHSLALLSDATVRAWGDNSYGQTNIPPALTNVVRIAAGHNHSLALKRDGSIVAWGQNDHDECNVPPNVTNVVAISAGDGFSLALRTNGNVYAWGDNTYGQTNLPSLPLTAAIAAGGYHAVALRENGLVAAWGQNALNQTNVPFVFAIVSSGLASVSAGAYHSMALKGTGGPYVTGQPWDQQVPVGSNATFAVQATGNGTLYYFWQFNGTTVLSGSNRRVYLRANAQPGDAGQYSVIISNQVGMATSSVANLTVGFNSVPPSVLTALGYDASGFRARLSGVPGTYVIEFSTNLATWIPGQTNVIPQSGFLDLVDPFAVGAPRRAYRAYWKP